MMRTSTLWRVASMYHYGGRKDLAAPLMKKAIEAGEKEIARLEKANPDDYQIPAMLGQLGYMYRQSGDLANAERSFVKAIAIAQKKRSTRAGRARSPTQARAGQAEGGARAAREGEDRDDQDLADLVDGLQHADRRRAARDG